jgi:hypothetical protein
VNHGEIVSFLWGVADLIRDTFKRGEYGAKASLKDSGSTLHKKRRCETRLNSRPLSSKKIEPSTFDLHGRVCGWSSELAG